MANLRYPMEMLETSTDYIIIDTVKYRTNREWGGNGGGVRGQRVGPSVILYMPNSTPPMNNPNTWQGKSFSGPLGELVGNAATGAVNATYNLGEALKSGGFNEAMELVKRDGKSTIMGIVEKVKENAGPAVGQGVTKAVAGMAGMSENQLLAMSRGEIFNPNMELLYEGPQLRGFSLNFTFLPKSLAEAAVVNQIIKHFKVNASPSDDRGGNTFSVPNVFEVAYMNEGKPHPFMNRFKRSALSDINITYNAGLPFHSTFDNGMPVKTDMTLSFLEVDIITREDHEGAPVGF
jgi:hypothetical protein